MALVPTDEILAEVKEAGARNLLEAWSAGILMLMLVEGACLLETVAFGRAKAAGLAVMVNKDCIIG